MRAALLSGLGPSSKNSAYLNGSLFDATPSRETSAILAKAGFPGLRLDDFECHADGGRFSLLRPLRTEPAHLTTFSLESILHHSRHEFVHVPARHIWDSEPPGRLGSVDVVLLSTTYIWNLRMLGQAVTWIGEHLPGIPIVAGGQYTNLKYSIAMTLHPEIAAIVRGDGEVALPMLLDRLSARGTLDDVPNLVWRDRDQVRVNPMGYVDLDEFPSPAFPGHLKVVPYESMRGCPFDCKFCGFPLATPKWRYKSAQKIRDDWVGYAEHNGAGAIEAMDSTFTVPPTRLRELFEILPSAGVPWECYSRANVINSPEFVDKLLKAHCFRLVIGFESMNDQTLRQMSKRVTAAQNRRALDLLRDSDMGYSVCFIVGYPGESRAQFEDTRKFLLDDFSGRFQLHLFGMTDETMPLWSDRETLQIQVDDPYDSDSAWSHVGMNSDEARTLQATTLDEVRRRSDDAVYLYWQGRYEGALLPGASAADNLVIEKAIERLAMVARDHSDLDDGAAAVRAQIALLARHDVAPSPALDQRRGELLTRLNS
jgi:anaerobic magnesium-protoporphyrin IX monomethyl ester cyclase